jgi:hypothetical protein
MLWRGPSSQQQGGFTSMTTQRTFEDTLRTSQHRSGKGPQQRGIPQTYEEDPRDEASTGLCYVAQGKKRPKTCPYPAATSKAQVYWARAKLNEISKSGGSTHEEVEKLIALATTPLRDLPDKAGFGDEELYRRKRNGHYTRK